VFADSVFKQPTSSLQHVDFVGRSPDEAQRNPGTQRERLKPRISLRSIRATRLKMIAKATSLASNARATTKGAKLKARMDRIER